MSSLHTTKIQTLFDYESLKNCTYFIDFIRFYPLNTKPNISKLSESIIRYKIQKNQQYQNLRKYINDDQRIILEAIIIIQTGSYYYLNETKQTSNTLQAIQNIYIQFIIKNIDNIPDLIKIIMYSHLMSIIYFNIYKNTLLNKQNYNQVLSKYNNKVITLINKQITKEKTTYNDILFNKYYPIPLRTLRKVFTFICFTNTIKIITPQLKLLEYILKNPNFNTSTIFIPEVYDNPRNYNEIYMWPFRWVLWWLINECVDIQSFTINFNKSCTSLLNKIFTDYGILTLLTTITYYPIKENYLSQNDDTVINFMFIFVYI